MPGQLEAIAELVERRAEGVRLSTEEIAELRGDRANGLLILHSAETLEVVAAQSQAGGAGGQGAVIAVISVFGVLAQRTSMMDELCGSGGTSVERAAASFRSALSDPAVASIVLNFDSPGGSVYGIQAFADEIFKARGQKPIVAQVNSLAASAAYWLATAADEIVVTPGGEVGSIGVYGLHRDVSKAAEQQGVKFTLISAGKYKTEGNQFEPLSEEAMAAAQSMVDSYYSDFTSAVARGRGVSASDVVNGFGEGRTVKDKQAVKLGMADRVAPIEDTLRRLSGKRASPAKSSAAAEDIAAVADVADAPAEPADEEWNVEPAAESTSAAEIAADAYRRRRHAHRLRTT
jgi:signal peptide peptidase SppA